MRGDDLIATMRDRLATPVTPLRGLAVLVLTALAGSVALSVLAEAGAPPPAPPTIRDEPVVVHVGGLVGRPGLYTLPAGARVADAVNAAGGPTAEADLSAVNLARVLEDGEQLLLSAPGDRASTAGATRADGRLDLNRATAAELDALPGIGPVLAARIVDHRERQGPFRTVGDLRRVQGIGDKLYRALEELVAV